VNSGFANVRILDNFYQTSSLFPLPVLVVSIVREIGQTNLGPYSLCFPHVIGDQNSISNIGALMRMSVDRARVLASTGPVSDPDDAGDLSAGERQESRTSRSDR
jgi:hypothetical protein